MARLGRIRDEAAIQGYLRQSIINLARKHWRKLGTERAYLRREGGSIASRPW
jgi:DNA-directed RNA polymerase specialized sigma24 family protein